MSMHLPSILRACALGIAFISMPATAAPAVAAAPARTLANQIPVALFVANATFSGALLSPNAKFLAVRFGGDNERDRLAVVDLVNNTVKVVGQMKTMDVTDFLWVNDNRLVFDSSDRVAQPGQSRGSNGLYAVNRDGSLQRSFGRVGGLTGHRGAQNSDTIYVSYGEGYKGETTFIGLQTLDTISGKMQNVHRAGMSRAWLLDSKGLPRASTTIENNKTSVHYLDPATDKWRKLTSHDAWFPGKDAMTPVAVGPDGNLFVEYRGERDKSALHTYDVKTNQLNPTPLVALEDHDFSGGVIIHKDKVLGVHYLSDAPSTVWFDEGMKAIQAKIDAMLPDTNNLITMAERPEIPWVLVQSYSDRQAGLYFLYNTETGKLNPVGEARPKLNPADMASQEALRIKARDGLVIPAYMTVPNGARKNLPMVVLVHGGPYVRGGQWGFNGSAQFLASRGYVVMEPEFRGSTGYGQKHYQSGWQQWGLNMQNDIADVTRWAIAEGIADPKRICIAGASYGGYATLMGLVNDPDLYQCGINWVGVTDLGLLHTGPSSFQSDLGESYKKHGMPTLIGEPVRDAVRYKATSPIQQASRIKQPVLMAYGALDRRVPFYHAEQFNDAVKATNKDVELIVYDDEGHGWFYLKNRIDFWTRVENFLDKHIGKK